MKKHNNLFLALFFILSIIAIKSAKSQISQIWLRTHNGSANSYDYGSDMIFDNAGNTIVTGSSAQNGPEMIDVVTIKYSPSGSIIWQSLFGTGDSISENGNKLAQDNSGNIYVLGYIPYAVNLYVILLIKYNSSGVLQWSRIQADTGSVYLPADIVIDNSGNVYVSAYGGPAVNGAGIVIKYAPDGNKLWYKLIRKVHDLQLSADNSLIVCGWNGANYSITKIAQDSSVLWTKYINSPCGICDKGGSITTDNQNNVYFTGQKNDDIYIIKYSNSGSMLWEKYYSNSTNSYDNGYSILLDNNGDLIVGGFTNEQFSSNYNMLIQKYTSGGSLVWSFMYDSPYSSIDVMSDLKIDNNSNIYVTGSSFRNNNQISSDIVTFKILSNGLLSWDIRYNGEADSSDHPSSVLTDNSGNVYEFGSRVGLNSQNDYILIKYSQLVGSGHINGTIPKTFSLKQNYPNPFNPETIISFDLPEKSHIRISVYDILGKQLELLIDNYYEAGTYSINFNSEKYPSGVYFYKMQTDKFSDSKKMIIAK